MLNCNFCQWDALLAPPYGSSKWDVQKGRLGPNGLTHLCIMSLTNNSQLYDVDAQERFIVIFYYTTAFSVRSDRYFFKHLLKNKSLPNILY